MTSARCVRFLALLVACAAPTLRAQTSGTQPGAVFRATTRLVQVDVTVTDGRGQPVPGLAPGDFVLTQDGETVPVRFATFVAGVPASPTGAGAPRVPTFIVFFIDDYRLGFESLVRVRTAFEEFLPGVPPGTQMLVMPASFFGEKNFTFTTLPRAIQAEIDALTRGKASRSGPRRGAAGSCDALSSDVQSDPFRGGTLGTLSGLLTSLQPVEGRKAVVVLTDGLFNVCRQEQNATERLRRLTDIANRSSVVLYGAHTAGFSASASNMADDDLVYLAERTGGLVGRSNRLSDVLQRMMTDQQGYYLLAYEPPPATFTRGKPRYRKIDVSSPRPGVHVRTRAGFYGVAE